MGFLILSLDQPSRTQRAAFYHAAGPQAKAASPLLAPLAAAANLSQWQVLLKAWDDHVDATVLNTAVMRPLKPKDDDYEAFQAQKWKPEGQPDLGPLASMIGDMTYPHYDRCAQCTKPATNKCSKCKIVHFCSRECQTQHWNGGHKKRCQKAREISLKQALTGNDGFRVTPEECTALCEGLKKQRPRDDLTECFIQYFDHASKLGGCFIC